VLAFSIVSFSKCLIQTWTKSDVIESECSGNTEHTDKR